MPNRTDMIIHFINPFQYGGKKQWDMCFMEEGEQILRQTVNFDATDGDEIIEAFGATYFETQQYKDSENNPLNYTEIIIDKPMLKYKDFDLKQLPKKGISISFEESWINGSFVSIESAKYFIDNIEVFTDDSLDKMQQKAIATNDGYITIDIIKEIAEL